jgi:2-dehydro-3-deoxygluconokinase
MSRVVTFGGIMLRLATPGFVRFQQAMPGGLNATFAGAEASIAASLAYLGVDAAFVTALPDHAIATGCLAHSIEGDYNYSTRAEIEAVMHGDGGGRVSR